VIGNLSWLCRCLPARLTLHHDVEVDQLLCESRHVILEAERVLSNGIGGQNVVALPFAFAIEYDFLIWIFDVKVYVE